MQISSLLLAELTLMPLVACVVPSSSRSGDLCSLHWYVKAFPSRLTLNVFWCCPHGIPLGLAQEAAFPQNTPVSSGPLGKDHVMGSGGCTGSISSCFILNLKGSLKILSCSLHWWLFTASLTVFHPWPIPQSPAVFCNFDCFVFSFYTDFTEASLASSETVCSAGYSSQCGKSWIMQGPCLVSLQAVFFPTFFLSSIRGLASLSLFI